MKIEFQNIDHVQLSITPGSVEQARDFYCGVLGLVEINRPKALDHIEGFWLAIANTHLHIASEEKVCETRRHPAFEVKNIKKIRTYLLEQNVHIVHDQELPGITRFSLYDPWGNRIELLEKKLGF